MDRFVHQFTESRTLIFSDFPIWQEFIKVVEQKKHYILRLDIKSLEILRH